MTSAASKVAPITPEPVYDFQTIPNGLQAADIRFFGQGLSAGRSMADTNIETGGQLPSDRLKAIAEVSVLAAFFGATAAEVAQAEADLHQLAQQAALVLSINGNPIIRLPVGQCGGGFGVTGISAIGADAGSGIVVLGNPGARGFKFPQSDWVPIPGGSTFKAEIVWSGDMPVTFAAARRIGISIGGPMARKGGR